MKIALDELAPTEPVLDGRKLAWYRAALRSGEPLLAIQITPAGSVTVVRDGNHHLRSLIEHSRATSTLLEYVDVEMSAAQSPPADWVLKIAQFYGTGESAFLSIPVGQCDDEIKQLTIGVKEKILAAKT